MLFLTVVLVAACHSVVVWWGSVWAVRGDRKDPDRLVRFLLLWISVSTGLGACLGKHAIVPFATARHRLDCQARPSAFQDGEGDRTMRLRAESLCKSLRLQQVFVDLCFDWTGPGLLAVLGENGSGKSTLLRMIAGVSSADKGVLWLDDEALSSGNHRVLRRIGYVPDTLRSVSPT